MEDKEGRFSHLLQPIRDLAKNWEIDVAKQLEEYLDEIEQITFTFDGGTTFLNFAEAALLIQGSASIYSKKIEYLYALVYQTLDLIAERQRHKQPTSVDEQGADTDVTFHKRGQEEPFISLDDIKEANNIDLIEDDQSASISHISPRTPISLIPKDGHCKHGDMQLLSGHGEVLGNRRDFRVNTSVIHSTGALLIDISYQVQMDKIALTTQNQERRSIMLINTSLVAHETSNIQDGFNSEDDFDNGGINDTLMDDANLAIEPQEALQDDDNPWRTIDPHDQDAVAERQLRTSRNWRLPRSITDKKQTHGKRKRDGPIFVHNQPMSSIIEFCSKATMKQNKRPVKQSLAALCEGLQYLTLESIENQQALNREINKLFKLLTSSDGNNNGDQQYNNNGADDDNYSDPDLGPVDDNFMDQGIAMNGENNIDPMVIEDHNIEQQIPQTYEDLVKQHLNEFAKATREYVQNTSLICRVNDWQDRIKPILENDGKHPPFDIHTYGRSVLNALNGCKDTQSIPFRSVVSHKEPYEICRLFAATLQLANNGNVEISSNDDRGINAMKVKLLTTELPHEALLNYKAPSLEEIQVNGH